MHELGREPIVFSSPIFTRWKHSLIILANFEERWRVKREKALGVHVAHAIHVLYSEYSVDLSSNPEVSYPQNPSKNSQKAEITYPKQQSCFQESIL